MQLQPALGDYPPVDVVIDVNSGGVDLAVKEPEINPGSVQVVVAVSNLLEASSSSNSQLQPVLCDCPPVDVVIDVDTGGGEMVPDGGEVICSSESSASADDGDEDDEELKDGDSSCFFEEPFYFAKVPSKSFSKMEVSRHHIAFVRGTPRLMCLWEGESHLVFGIGGHLQTVVDWYLVRKRNETAVSGWLPVSDPERPDVPLWIEFTAVNGKEEVVAGTAFQRPNESLVPWIFMLNSNRAGDDVNTQFFWCADGPPRGFWTSVPILCVALPWTTFQLGRICGLTLTQFGNSMGGQLWRLSLLRSVFLGWTPVRTRGFCSILSAGSSARES